MTTRSSKKNIEAVYPLSPMQEGMLFHSLLAPDEGYYFETFTCTFRGDLDTQAFEKAWVEIISRHTILRTSFVWKRLDQMLQVVHQQVELPLVKLDWRGLSGGEIEDRLTEYLEMERKRGFDLAKAPLIRLALMQTGDDSYTFAWCYHHALLDGWSQPLLMKELITLYAAFSENKRVYLEPVPPYRNYIDWIQKKDESKAEAYWREVLAGFDTPTPLVVKRPILFESSQGDHIEHGLALTPSTTKKLLSLAGEHNLTVNTIVLGAWAMLLSRYSGQMDVLFGSTVAGRPPDMPGSDRMVGLFINTLPMRVRIPQDGSVISWLQGIQAQQVEMRQFEHTPLVKIQEWSEIPAGVQLFESIFVFENYPVASLVGGNDRQLRIEDVNIREKANYPLTLVAALGEELFVKLAYDARIIEGRVIARMLDHLCTLIEGMVESPDSPPSLLPLLTPAEREQILGVWNDTSKPFPEDQCIHHLFEERAALSPDAQALVFNGSGFTYRQLNQQANQLAHYLLEIGVNADSYVGIYLDRSPSLVVAILGVLKAGGAYVPLDVNHPLERLDYMIQDAGLQVILTENLYAKDLPASQGILVPLDDPATRGNLEKFQAEDPSTGSSASDLAYLIYTSGSTGLPKGVMLEHRGLVNLVLSQIDSFGIQPGDRLLQFASVSFDASVSEIFTALVSGATLVLANQETLSSPAELVDFLEAQGINVVTLPPSLLKVMPVKELPALKSLISAGEKCPWEVVPTWSTGRRFLNAYGPTEATIGPTCYVVKDGGGNHRSASSSVPIGRPIQNTQIFILDEELRPVPVGVTGELHIAGVGLARGYLNQPELTGEKFIHHAFNGGEEVRVYKTGDLGRYLPDGNIEYVDRVDFQVKVRGYRIELGEVESVLSQHPSVSSVVVVDHQDKAGDTRLVAYVVAEGEADQDVAALRSFLQSKLPAYMVPSLYIFLPELPYTISGKVDRSALPEPDGARTGLEDRYVPPQTPHQELLAGIYSNILGVKSIGIDDSFFELGGHSLLVTRLISRIRKAFQVEVDLRKVFDAPTVRELAEVIRESSQREETVPPPIEPAVRTSELPLSYAQQRLWFLDQLLPGSAFYNIPVALTLSGDLDIDVLEKSLNQVIHRHETLRTTFVLVDGEPVQKIAPELIIKIVVKDLSQDHGNADRDRIESYIIEEARTPFDLSTGPLLRVKAFRVSREEHIILLTLHHIIADGWSMQVLIREIAMLYRAYISGVPSPLQDLPIQYLDYTIWQKEWLQGDVLEAQKHYWSKQLSGAPSILELPSDRPRPSIPTSKGAHLSFELSPDLSAALREFSQGEGATLFMVLISAFMTMLFRYSGQTDINVGTPIANRNRDEIEGLIGFFVNTLVIRGDLSGNPSFREFLSRMREVAFDAYSHQDLPFETLVEMLQPVRDMSHSPLFQVMFTLDNVPAESIDLPGLTMTPLESESGTSKFDLTLSIHDGVETLGGNFEYNTDLFDQSTIERMADHFRVLLEGILDNPDRHLAEMPVMRDAEKIRMVVEWNKTSTPFASDLCIHELFEKWAQHSPEAIAASYGNDQLTYQELDRHANQLANYLTTLGVGEETLVGVCLERSLALVVSLLGVWKAGAAYVPLDPEYPKDRLGFMLSDSNIKVLITQDHLRERLPDLSIPVVTIDQDRERISSFSQVKPDTRVIPDNLAYVIYTSGSTGAPKGVLLPHTGLLNVVAAQQAAFEVGPGDRVLQFSSLSFDAATFELVMALGTGATLCLNKKEDLLPGRDLLTTLEETGPSVVVFPPSALKVLPEAELPNLRVVTVAGETCPAELVDRWANGRKFFNLYGPTEDTIWATYARCENGGMKPPIGKPIQNNQVYVLDDYGEVVPVGVPGELYLGGVGVARGYLAQPGLTAERFIPNPFGQGGRLYKTGDIARYLSDGNLEFLGREDDQVKVRGFRIELGEIEVALREHADVQEAVVMARSDGPGEPQLVAYVIPENETNLNASPLRQHLAGKLPNYMIPSVFVNLETLPLLPSGKVDRKALPAPEGARQEGKAEYAEPRTQLEITLVKMWQKIIRVDQIGIHDNFFDLGGDSIRGAIFINQLEKVLGESIFVAALFEAQTISELADYLSSNYPEAVARTLGSEALSDEDIAVLAAMERPLEVPDSVHPAIVPIQTEGDKVPLFCVHSAGGVVFPYYNLVPYMGYDQPLYGIQRPTFVEVDEKLSSLEKLASFYTEGMRKVQPHGPYCVAGWSSGGVVAFEIAHQLVKQGEEVAFLGVIDFKAPYQRSPRKHHIRSIGKGRIRFGRFRIFLKFFRSLPYFIKEFYVLLKVALSYTRDGLYLKYSNPRGKERDVVPADEKPTLIEYFKWFWVSAIRDKLLDRAEVANVVSRNSDLMLIELPTVRHTLGRVGKDIRITQRYIPKKYNGTITLFNAGSFEGDAASASDPTMGWHELTSGEVVVRKIPGNHMAVLRKPYVEPFANIVKDCLAKALRDH